MSDPRSKAERSRAKDLRQGLPQRSVIHGKRKPVDKPFRVYQRHTWVGGFAEPEPKGWWFSADWRYSNKRFATAELANDYVEKELRCWRFGGMYTVEFKVMEDKL